MLFLFPLRCLLLFHNMYETLHIICYETKSETIGHGSTLALSCCFLICSAPLSFGTSSEAISASISPSHDCRSAWVSLKCDVNGNASSNSNSRSLLRRHTRSAWLRMVFSLFLMSSASEFVVSRSILLHLSMVWLTVSRLLSRSSWNTCKGRGSGVNVATGRKRVDVIVQGR